MDKVLLTFPESVDTYVLFHFGLEEGVAIIAMDSPKAARDYAGTQEGSFILYNVITKKAFSADFS